MKTKNIFLVGFMGSGKSTVGKILAQKLNKRFLDIDTLIEEKEGKSIRDIFKTKGEKYFRKKEKEEIEHIVQKKGFIVSTGGGLGADIENMEKMKRNGTVIWLDVSLEEILKRCGNDKNRPLLNQPIENIKKLFEKRKDVYSKADIRIIAENKTPEEIAEEILERLK